MIFNACATTKVPSYSYCLVQDCQSLKLSDGVAYVTRCLGNNDVIFPKAVNEGEEVYYSPYWVDEDTVTVYGYIKAIKKVAR